MKHVKENDLVHGEWIKWLESIDMTRQHAHRFIKVHEELGESNVTSTLHLGIETLYQIATLPPEEREKEHVTSKGETKTVDNYVRLDSCSRGNFTAHFWAVVDDYVMLDRCTRTDEISSVRFTVCGYVILDGSLVSTHKMWVVVITIHCPFVAQMLSKLGNKVHT